MHSIQKGEDSVQLKNTHLSASIIPACGALLNALIVTTSNGDLNLIDAFTDSTDAREHIAPAFQSAKLSPFACRIEKATYQYQGTTYKFEKCLDSGGNALHGLLYNEPFSIIEATANETYARLELLHQYQGDEAGYPFAYDCTVIYTLQNDSLTITTEIVNRSEQTMPLTDGWHPYFTFHKPINDLELQFHASQMLEFIDLIPTGKYLPNQYFTTSQSIGNTELDNAFLIDTNAPQPTCILRDPASKLQIEITPDHNYPILQIYTPPHRNSIAIENISGAPDAFNNGIGLTELPASQQKSFSTTYTIRSLEK